MCAGPQYLLQVDSSGIEDAGEAECTTTIQMSVDLIVSISGAPITLQFVMRTRKAREHYTVLMIMSGDLC